MQETRHIRGEEPMFCRGEDSQSGHHYLIIFQIAPKFCDEGTGVGKKNRRHYLHQSGSEGW